MDLSPKQQRFCEEYVKDLNGTQAATRAGYSPKTANEQSSRLLAKVNVQEKIAQLQAEITERNKLKADDVIQELRALGFWSINDFIGEGNIINDISTQERDMNKPVVGIKITEKFTTFGKGDEAVTEKIVTTELKFADKRGALVDLGRHLGVFKEDNEQQNPIPAVTRIEIVKPKE